MPRVVCVTLKCSTWSPVLKLNPRLPILVCTHTLAQWHTVMLCAQVLLLEMEFFLCAQRHLSLCSVGQSSTDSIRCCLSRKADRTVTWWRSFLITAKTKLFNVRHAAFSSVPWGTIQQCDHGVWKSLRTTMFWMRCAASSATVAHPKKAIAALPRSVTLGR